MVGRQVYHLLIVLLVISARHAATKEILGVFPHFGYSHFKVFYPLMRNLAERGHHVTVITHIASSDPPLDNYEELMLPNVEGINVVPLSEWQPRTWRGLLEEYVDLYQKGQSSCERLYESGHIQSVLRRHVAKPYDILITEFFNSDCQLALAHLMSVPIVGLSSCLLMPWYYDRILLPDTPSFVQSEFIGFSTPLSWSDRLTNFLQAKVLSLLYRYHANLHDNALIERYMNLSADVDAIAKQRTVLVLSNQHYSLTGIRPHSEQLVEIGGIHIREQDVNKTLPKDIDKFLENSSEDVFFISWGSMIRSSTMDPKKLQAILAVLTRLNLRVIWKWESEQAPIASDRILFTKWAPQLALLCHPKVKLFWGHGGLLGTTEAVYCGKPMLVTPIYGDQFVNGHAVENREIGRILHYNDINELNVERAIQELRQARLTNNALGIAKVFRDRPLKPLDTATWWVEHVLEHKHSSTILHTHAVDLNWFVYYSLDSLSIIALAVAILAYVAKKTLTIALHLLGDLIKPVKKLKRN